MRHGHTTWTVEQDELCVKLWREGHSGTEIGQRLGGKTRNAVIGRLHRMKEPKRAPDSLVGRQRRYYGAPRPARQRGPGGGLRNKLSRMMFADLPPMPIDLFADNNPHPDKNVPLMSATANQCREVVGHNDDGLAMFCGAAFAHKSFCAYHAGLNYTRPVDRRVAVNSSLQISEAA